MITLKNPLAANEWIINLKEYPQVENSLPMAGLNVRNDSNIVAYVDLDGLKVGEVQRYSADPFQGRNYSLIRIYNPDGQNFAADDLFIQITKGEVVGSQPFNPQWDMMFDNLDRFSTGTDSRISISDTITPDMVKYCVNTHNPLIVQRRLDIQAHATLLGDYKIIFSSDDVLSGAVGIGTPPPPDIVYHKKTISDSVFSYTLTNTSIVGWMIDYLTTPLSELVNDYTLITGTNGANAYDGDYSNPTDYYTNSSDNVYQTLWEVSFNSITLNGFHAYVGSKTTGASSYFKFQYYDGAWKDMTTPQLVSSVGGAEYFYPHHLNGLSYPSTTKIRLQSRKPTGVTIYTRLYDIHIMKA